MVGNDIVDLLDPEAQPGALHQRFDNRVFTTEEQGVISGSADPHHTRWTLWACKESAYKLIKRHFPSVVFSQREFTVELQSSRAARVRFRRNTVAVALSRHASAVHAVAVWAPDDGCRIVWGVGEDRVDPSSAVRDMAARRISRVLRRPPSDVGFSSGSDRIPRLEVDGQDFTFPVSFSHHGSYVAFACFFFSGCAAVS